MTTAGNYTVSASPRAPKRGAFLSHFSERQIVRALGEQGAPAESGEYPKGYTCVSNAALTMWWRGEISESAFRVYSYLASRQNDNVCWPRQATIAATIGKSLATVKRALNALEAKKLVRREARFENGEQRSSVYTLLPIGGGTVDHASVDEGGTVAHLNELPFPVSAPNELGGSSLMNGGVAHLYELGGSSPKMSYQQQDSLEQDSIKNNNNIAREGEKKNVVDVVALLCEQDIEETQARRIAQKHPTQEIVQQIKWLPYRNAKNPPAMLVSAIERRMAAPPGYVPPCPVPKPRPLPATAASDASVPASSMSAPLPAAESPTTATTSVQDAPASWVSTGRSALAHRSTNSLPTDGTSGEWEQGNKAAFMQMKEKVAADRLASDKRQAEARAKPMPEVPQKTASPTAPPSAPATRPLPPRTDGLSLQRMGQSQEFKSQENTTRVALLTRRFQRPEPAAATWNGP